MRDLGVPKEAVEELKREYARLDEELSRIEVACRKCGGCCHFGSSGLYLYLSRVEAVLFLEEAKLKGDENGEECPHLVEKRCTARAARAIGCRTYFCNPKERLTMEALYEKYLARAKGISEAHGVGWEYGPLGVWLEWALEGAGGKV